MTAISSGPIINGFSTTYSGTKEIITQEDRVLNIVSEYLDVFDHSPKKIARWFEFNSDTGLPKCKIKSSVFCEDLEDILRMGHVAKAFNANVPEFISDHLSRLQSKKFHLFINLPRWQVRIGAFLAKPATISEIERGYMDRVYQRAGLSSGGRMTIRTSAPVHLTDLIKETSAETRLQNIINRIPKEHKEKTSPRFFSVYHVISLLPQPTTPQVGAVISSFSYMGNNLVGVLQT